MKNNKIKFRIVHLIRLILVLGGLVLGLSLRSQQVTTKQNHITIKGVIENYNKIKSQFAKDSYLQLIVVPPDGSVNMRTDSDGRVFCMSDYAKTAVSNSGTFLFQIDNLKPGVYNIIVQLLQHRPYNAALPFLIQNSDFVKIVVKKDMQPPAIFDMGKCSIKE